MAERKQFFTITIPADYKPADREIVGQRIIRFVQERTRKGLDVNHDSFVKYSKSYKDSLDFKIAGKSSRVNLEQTGDMVGTIDILNHGRGFITIGFEKGSEENDKAAWMQENTQPGFPKRKFLGITQKDLKEIIESTPPKKELSEPAAEKREKEEETGSILGSAVESIFKRLGL